MLEKKIETNQIILDLFPVADKKVELSIKNKRKDSSRS